MTTSVAVAARPHRTSFARLALRRILAGLITLLVVSALVFVGTELLPGDAASAVPRTHGAARAARRDARARWVSTGPRSSATSTGSAACSRATSATRPRDTRRGRRRRSGTTSAARSGTRVILAAIVVALMIPLSLLLGSGGGDGSRSSPRPRDLAGLPRGRLAARVHHRVAPHRRLLLVARRAAAGLARSAGDEPARAPRDPRAPDAHAARRDARRLDADGARRDARVAALRLRPDGAAQRPVRAAGRPAVRASQRARARGAGLRAEHPVPDRRDHRRRVPLQLPGHREGARRRGRHPRRAERCSRSRS